MSGEDGSRRSKVPFPLNKHQWRPSPLPGQVILVTTVDGEGRLNVATKSWISMASFGPPPVLMFGCNLKHATARNALEGGSFVVNVPGIDLAEVCWELGTNREVAGEARFAHTALRGAP